MCPARLPGLAGKKTVGAQPSGRGVGEASPRTHDGGKARFRGFVEFTREVSQVFAHDLEAFHFPEAQHDAREMRGELRRLPGNQERSHRAKFVTRG